ncbi:MAG: hypothetical protein P8Q85_00840, partial [Candidatus Poseidoniaceae archaeon]|nr:hypothetical protein [Candidatus Poseidoniaceae archaeon]
DEYIHADLEDAPVKPQASPPASAQDDDAMMAFMGQNGERKHAAAMELAPSKSSTISLDDAFEAPAQESVPEDMEPVK